MYDCADVIPTKSVPLIGRYRGGREEAKQAYLEEKAKRDCPMHPKADCIERKL
jgi:hypothetical protein